MDSVWYYVQNGAQTGPVSFNELKEAAGIGKLTPGDLVWKEGTADWVAARTVAGLFSGPPPPSLSGGRPPEPLPLDDDLAPGPISLDDAPRERRAGGGGGSDLAVLIQEFIRRTVSTNPAALDPTPAEKARLTQTGVIDVTGQRFAVWRRAVLWITVVPTGFAALFGLINVINMDKDESRALSSFGILLQYLQAFALFALPATAILAANVYHRLGISTRWVLLGGLVSLGVPLVIAFVPGDMILDLKIDKKQTVAEVEAQKSTVGLGLGIAFYLTLMPAVLSLLPAVSRSCVRVKSFLPESLVPGWGLVASVPLCVLLTLATFVLLYHVVGNTLLIVGLLLWVGAPMLYLSRFHLLTRPVTDPAEMDVLAKTQMGVLGLIVAGVVLLVIYLFTAKFFGMTIVGTEKEKSLIRPWNLDLHKKWIEYVGRSMFLTVLFADLLVRMALSVWREERAFAGTKQAAEFDSSMAGLSTAIEPGRAEPLG